jgi:hypothetical protein
MEDELEVTFNENKTILLCKDRCSGHNMDGEIFEALKTNPLHQANASRKASRAYIERVKKGKDK